MSRNDVFIATLIGFVTNLHDCHICKYFQEMISGRNGKTHLYCTKYGLPMKRVRWNCIDRFQGFNEEEIKELHRQRKAGLCTLVIGGEAV